MYSGTRKTSFITLCKRYSAKQNKWNIKIHEICSNLQEHFSYLFVVTVFCLVVKYIKPRSCIETRMVIPSFYDWCYIMSIGESCQSIISYVDRMLCNTLPIRVLIDCEKNKTKNQQMQRVSIGFAERGSDIPPPVLLLPSLLFVTY